MRENSTFYDFLGFDSDITSEGEFRLELPFQSFLVQDDGTVHPGVFSTMLDIVMGADISRRYESFATTINLNVSLFQLSKKNIYKASTSILHKDHQYVTAEGMILDQDEMLVAKGTGTFKISSKPKKLD